MDIDNQIEELKKQLAELEKKRDFAEAASKPEFYPDQQFWYVDELLAVSSSGGLTPNVKRMLYNNGNYFLQVEGAEFYRVHLENTAEIITDICRALGVATSRGCEVLDAAESPTEVYWDCHSDEWATSEVIESVPNVGEFQFHSSYEQIVKDVLTTLYPKGY